MKKNYLEGLIIVAIYMVTASIINLTDNTALNAFIYPLDLIIEPFQNNKINFEAINLAAFTLYFMWSLSCVYLSFIKKLVKFNKL